MLEPDEEFMLAKRYKEHDDPGAAQRLITSHLRLVAKIAMGYRGYGLPISEVISRAMSASCTRSSASSPTRASASRPTRCGGSAPPSRNMSCARGALVKIGTTAAQKRLFFNLRKVKGQIAALDDGNLHPDQIKQIATTLHVTEADVVSMNQRLTGDASLNAPDARRRRRVRMAGLAGRRHAGPGDRRSATARSTTSAWACSTNAMGELNEREKAIFQARRLQDDPATLEELAQEYNVSRERIRQIEVRAFEKVQEAVTHAAKRQSRASRSASGPRPAAKASRERPFRSPRNRCRRAAITGTKA